MQRLRNTTIYGSKWKEEPRRTSKETITHANEGKVIQGVVLGVGIHVVPRQENGTWSLRPEGALSSKRDRTYAAAIRY